MAGLARVGWIAGVIGLLVASTAANADPAPGASRSGSPNPGPAQVVTSDGHVWERIPMRSIDPRYLAMILGGRALPTEMDLFMMRNRGMALPGGYGGGYSGYGGYGGAQAGFGGYAVPMGTASYGSSGPMGLRIYGDPNSNSLLVGPGGFPGGPGAGPGGNAFSGRGGLIPGLIIFGDPNTNSLIVDP